ncbi:MAG: nitrate/nitrite transporter NrtS [Thermomicrobiales bacterium]
MMSVREALRICLRPEHLRRTLSVALVVGTTMTIINQADVILGGDATTGTWIKAILNYCPVVVSNLGLPAGKGVEAVAARESDTVGGSPLRTNASASG